jgi:hypothetical protein
MTTQTKLVLAGLFVMVIVFALGSAGMLHNFDFGAFVNHAIATLPPVR